MILEETTLERLFFLMDSWDTEIFLWNVFFFLIMHCAAFFSFFFFLSKPFVLASISIRIFVIWGLGYKCVSVRADGFGVPLLLFTLSRALERIYVVMREIPFFMKDVETNSIFFI
jgi:hypothetical protein